LVLKAESTPPEIWNAHPSILGATPFAQLLITESPAPPLAPQIIQDSLPHLSLEQRRMLLSHYAGSSTWAKLCLAVGLEFAELPDTVKDVMQSSEL